MGIKEIIQSGPKRDPRYNLPPERDSVYYADLEGTKYQLGRNIRRVGYVAVAFATGSLIAVVASINNKPPHYDTAEPTATPEPNYIQETPSASPSESESESPSPSPSPTPKKTQVSPSLSMSPSHIPSPSITQSRKVITPTPTPTRETSKPAQNAACTPNENAPGEVVCDRPIWAYTMPDGGTHAFQINGPAAVECDQIQNGYVYVSISNTPGWASLDELGNPC